MMRLVCPNCEAVYEVPDDVVPPEGREVQCSNCSHAWYVGADGKELDVTFTPPPLEPPEPEPELEPRFESEPEGIPAAPVAPAAPAGRTHQVMAPPRAEYEPEAEDDVTLAATIQPQRPQRRPLEDQVKRVLRAEAEYEAQARVEDDQTLEWQEDLPLDTPQRQEPEIDLQAIATATGNRRRHEFPDIDEINSTLRSTSDRDEDYEPEPAAAAPDRARKRAGFRIGLGIAFLILGGLALLYAFADPIGNRVPALAGVLDSYQLAVNDLRRALAGLVQRVTSLLG
ncbi:MAG: zinc-ribbon domain-containing protein [Pseudomonadota bacterium]